MARLRYSIWLLHGCYRRPSQHSLCLCPPSVSINYGGLLIVAIRLIVHSALAFCLFLFISTLNGACTTYNNSILCIRHNKIANPLYLFMNITILCVLFLFSTTEHTMQASSDRITRCRIQRFACIGRIHLSRWSECSSTFTQLILKNGWSTSSVWTNTTTSWRNT